MNSIARAAFVINETYADEWVKSHMTPLRVAHALADDGQLMPDLPKTQFADDGTPYWTADEEVYQPSRVKGFIEGVNAYGEPFSYPVWYFKERAIAMLAAVYYIERNQE